jgi:hypothetical protein
MPTTYNPGGSIWVTRTRISQLSSNGQPAAGSSTYTTDTMMKATLTPVIETGDDIAIKAASGDLSVFGKHGDMIKYGTLSLELTLPDPQLEAICCGGVIFNDNSAALGLPTGLTVVTQATLGTLPASTYGYRATQYNTYGESLAEAEVTVTTTGGTSANVLSGVTVAAGAIGVGYYGRILGEEQLLGYQVAIGTQATSAASGTGTVTTLAVTSLTHSIPAGYTFQIAGDTNTPKIVFTTTTAAGVGALGLNVTASQSVTTTIAAGNIVPVFVDNGSLVPFQQPFQTLPLEDLTAGPGNAIGYQAPIPGPVAQPSGVSMEFWSVRQIDGFTAPDIPYYRTVLPRVANMHIQPRDYTNANLQTVMEGQAFRNPNWGSGPFGDWTFDSSQWYQRAPSGIQVLPAVGVAPVQATA